MAAAACDRPVRAPGEGAGLPLALGLQAAADRREGEDPQAGPARGGPRRRAIAIDLLPIAPISAVTLLKGDFRSESLYRALAGARADVVLSDLSPNLSGIGNVDQARALELTGAAIDFCCKVLKPEGVFVLKAFHGEAFDEVLQRLRARFGKVKVVKPLASRGESAETYVLGRGISG